MPRVAGALFLVLALRGLLGGQTFDFEQGREPLLSLDGLWRFHPGDDPHWADPNFDDTHWSLLRSDQPWDEQGYKGYNGLAWYRFSVRSVNPGPLTLVFTGVGDSYQVFVDGHLTTTYGQMPPHPKMYTPVPIVVAISGRRSSSDLRIALRVWKSNVEFFSNPGTGHRLGGTNALQSYYEGLIDHRLWHLNSQLILLLLEGIASLTALFLFLTRRSEYEYLWFCLMQTGFAAQRCFDLQSALVPVPVLHEQAFVQGSYYGGQLCAILFYIYLLQAPRRWFVWIPVSACVAYPVSRLLALTGLIPFIPAYSFALNAWLTLSLQGWILWAIWQALCRESSDARLLLGPVLLNVVAGFVFLSWQILAFLHLSVPHWLQQLEFGISFPVFPIELRSIVEFLFLLAVLAILLGRFTRTRRIEETYARELEAARTVQQVLLPEKMPLVPGFSIASVYQPAQQVGGDFFQVVPQANGMLVAIGDVSGKGLPAAMTVSLLVGTLRTLAEQTDSPAMILQGLNRRLVGRSSGFTTCLIARLHPDGSGTLANAGHLPPYCNGEEVKSLSNLPLGLSLDADYAESPVTLQPNDFLTFVSDGVVEARNTKGELFGFARTQQTSTQSAHIIATAAQHFGQEDDITVLTIEYQPLGC